ncbi:DUF817 domain-containing protein [bacterium]|nr:MAG: DUF817 domain-containing protein [bacterium]
MVVARVVTDFVVRQLQSSAFAIGLLAAMALTKSLPDLPIARYDLLFVICLLLQAGMIALRWETWREVGILAIFHIVGVGLEWFKVRSGSWSYPEPAVLKAYGVPFYSGFMYASVASYMSQAWRMLDLEFVRWPQTSTAMFVLAVVYGQFFLPVQTLNVRYAALLVVLFAFWRTRVAFTAGGERLAMPLPLSFLLIGTCIYGGENIATFFGAWTYPYQQASWQPVHVSKVISWTLLMVVSLAIVHAYHCRFGIPKLRTPALSTAHNE